ncbi:hypothetical protein [Allofournierella sp. CML151]|uniref:hypothetical protein n=1 Tax=Allofournierella sp. CML151 TaxID=2998082 RepID=UPI0022EAF2B3|nr:hypothetical protein [Fournierella sp. CML151]
MENAIGSFPIIIKGARACKAKKLGAPVDKPMCGPYNKQEKQTARPALLAAPGA